MLEEFFPVYLIFAMVVCCFRAAAVLSGLRKGRSVEPFGGFTLWVVSGCNSVFAASQKGS